MPRLGLFAFALAGCVRTAPLALDSADGRRTVNERATGRSTNVKILGTPRHAARDLHLAPDVTTRINVRTGALRCVATDSVESATFLNRTKGATVGAAGAALIGFAVGYEASSADGFFPREWLGFLLGGLATPIGAVVGAETGQCDVFRRGSYPIGTAPAAVSASAPDSAETWLGRRY